MRRAAFLGLAVGAGTLALLGACDGPASDKAAEGTPQAGSREVMAGIPDYASAGMPAPDVTLVRDGGAPMALTGFRGTPTLVNLWATWCAPCIAELPALDRLAAAQGFDMNIVAVSQDIGGWDKVTPVLEQNPLRDLTVLVDETGALGRSIGAAGLPVTIMYDAEGNELWRVNGPREWDQPGGLPAASAADAGPGQAASEQG
ncbi:MAG: TlpA disulfide reductase family protein [Pseudomonadota bacterium]